MSERDTFADILIEDEAEKENLLSKPTCFLIVGRPGVGKSTLARKIADSWKCILVDDTDILNTHIAHKTKPGLELLEILNQGKNIPEEIVLQLILDKLNTPEVEHYGYVLSALPFMSEHYMKINEQIELIKQLKLPPDFIINIKCPDSDLAERLSGLRQYPETGQFYGRDEWMRDIVSTQRREKESTDEEEEEEEEMAEEEIKKTMINQMVWRPEYLKDNVDHRVNIYKDMMLKPLENYIIQHNPLNLLELDGNDTPNDLLFCVISRLRGMKIPPPSVPILLSNEDDNLQEDIDMGDLLRTMSSSKVVVPGFRWRTSRWGRTCPVALKEGKVVPGIPDFCMGFQDKMYILSNAEAYEKFIVNPRRYLIPPMPSPPCHVCIIGPSLSGKSTLCKLAARYYNAHVLDVDTLVQTSLKQAELERLERIKQEAIVSAIEKINSTVSTDDGEVAVTEHHPEVQALVHAALEAKQDPLSELDKYILVLEKRIREIEQMDAGADVPNGWVLDNFPRNVSEMEALQEAGILPDVIFCLEDAEANLLLKRLYEKNKDSVDEAVKNRLQTKQLEKEKETLRHTIEEEEKAKAADLKTVDEEAEETLEQSEAGQDAPFEIIEEEDVPEKLESDHSEDEKLELSTSPIPPGRLDEETSQQPIVDSSAAIEEQQHIELTDHWELGYPDGPEMNVHKKHLQQFMHDWDQMQVISNVNYVVLELGEKKPEELLERVVSEMEKPFRYVARELTGEDLDEETEDMVELQREEESDVEEEEEQEEEVEEKASVTRLFGDTYHFCPVALKNSNVILPCNDENAAKYRERIYYFSSAEARDLFIQNPEQYVAQTELLKPPALRVLMLGTRGSGKTTNGKWLAQQLGLFYIEFREKLQMLIIEKTKKAVPYSDEEETSEEPAEDLEALIKEARGDVDSEADADHIQEEEVELTKDEQEIVAYLSDGEPLSPHILDMILLRFWKQEPYMSTGFILEGFPSNTDEVDYLVQQTLFPDALVTLSVDVGEIQMRLMSKYLENWREHLSHRQVQVNLLRELRQKKREESIAARRAELIAEMLAITKVEGQNEDDGGDEEDDKNPEEDIEALLEEEFPPEEHTDDFHNEEIEEAATERLQMDIAKRFEKDENSLSVMTELLGVQKIPILTVNAGGKLKKVRHQLLKLVQPLLTNRESLFQKCQQISCPTAHKLLSSSYKYYSAFGFQDPIQLYNEKDVFHPPLWPSDSSYPLIFQHFIYFFETKENRTTFMLNPLKYIRQPKPTPSLPMRLAIIGPPKSGKTTIAKLLAQNYGLTRLSIGCALRMMLETHEHTDLSVQIKNHLNQGQVVPDELAIRALETVLMCSVHNVQGYVLDGFPMTVKQAQLMSSRSIIPMVVAELKLDTLDILKRGLIEKMKPNQPYVTHNSAEIFHVRNSHYKQEVEFVRKYFQQQHRNWIQMDGLKSKWWIWKNILKEVSKSVKNIHNYLQRTHNGQAASINRMCITPEELQNQIGVFGYYCPVCLVLEGHLVDCSETPDMTCHAAEYRGYYYIMCGEKHLKVFLETPQKFAAPDCSHTLPPPHLLPKKLNGIQVKKKFPQQVQLRGFCPVTYHDGKHRYEALVRGDIEYSVEYRERIYVFETKQKQEMFLRTPEIYWDQRLPDKIPPPCEPVPLSSLPSVGYLEQGVAVSVIKAVTAVGCLKPKYPFLSVLKSALLYVAYYLKAFNPRNTEYIRQKYKKKLALFEENCALIPYLMSTMQEDYKPRSAQPFDFEFKLNKFLALEDTQRKK